VSSDGELLASASNDNTVKLLDAGSEAVLQSSNINTIIRALSFSNDGNFF
jgi:WD40 repeat protein